MGFGPFRASLDDISKILYPRGNIVAFLCHLNENKQKQWISETAKDHIFSFMSLRLKKNHDNSKHDDKIDVKNALIQQIISDM